MRQLYIPAAAFLAFSYPFTTVLILQFGLAPETMNQVIKAAITALFALSIIGGLNERRSIHPGLIPLFALFFLYGLRLLYDVVGFDILPPLSSASYVLLYFFVLTLFPATAVGLSFDIKDMHSIHKWLYVILILANLAVLYYVLFVGELAAEEAFAGRLEIRETDEDAAVLNPIVVSMMGSALALFVIGRLATFKQLTPHAQLWHLGLFALGTANLLIGGSRGPLVGFAIAVLFIAIAAAYSAGNSEQARLRPRVLLYLGAMFVVLFMLAASDAISIAVFDRFKDMFAPGGRGLEERDYIYAAAWDDFVRSPLLGNSYLTLRETALAHNVMLESLTSAGIIGGVLYLIIVWTTLKGIWNAMLLRLGPYAYSIALVALVLQTVSMTSGTIGQSPEVWVITTLIVCMVAALSHDRKARSQAPESQGLPQS